MSIPTDENRDLLTVVAILRAKPGKEEELREALEALIEPTKKEDGHHTYALHRDREDPSTFIFYENWTSPEHLDAHFQTAHLKDFVARTPDLLRTDLELHQLRRIA